MFKNNRYPIIGIRSKNELAKRISGKKLPYPEALYLVNDVLTNYNKYWRDNKKASDPVNDKYVRSAFGTPLGRLLDLINKKVLSPYDKLLPGFIFGGVSKKNHIQASLYLLGRRRKRTKLGADISKFFEQNKKERVAYFLNGKCECSKKASEIISNLCCIPLGPKNSGSSEKAIARGFATSTRLATWCNLDLFLRVDWVVKKMLKGHDPRITFFVDDIGISASDVDEKLMISVYNRIDDIFKNYDKNHGLPLNHKKRNIQSYKDGKIEHLGLRCGRNKVMIGSKTSKKLSNVKKGLSKDNLSKIEKKNLVFKVKSYNKYKSYIHKLNLANLSTTHPRTK